MLNAIILIPTAALFIWFGIKVYVTFQTETGSTWQKLLAATKDSATVLWSYIVGGAGMLIMSADKLADALNMPQVTSFIQQYLSPTSVGIAMCVIAIITVIARLRTLGQAS